MADVGAAAVIDARAGAPFLDDGQALFGPAATARHNFSTLPMQMGSIHGQTANANFSAMSMGDLQRLSTNVQVSFLSGDSLVSRVSRLDGVQAAIDALREGTSLSRVAS